MGDFADDEFDRMMELAWEAEDGLSSQIEILKNEQRRRKEEPNKEPEDEVWITKAGEVIPVGKMTDSHLENTIRFCERRLKEFRTWM